MKEWERKCDEHPEAAIYLDGDIEAYRCSECDMVTGLWGWSDG